MGQRKLLSLSPGGHREAKPGARTQVVAQKRLERHQEQPVPHGFIRQLPWYLQLPRE